MKGHVFVVRGDLTLLHCDARLFPTDSQFQITSLFGREVGLDDGGFLDIEPWEADERTRLFDAAVVPQTWLGRIALERVLPDERAVADWFAGGIRAFVEQALIKVRTKNLGRPPLLAINLVGTGDGGAHLRKGLVLDAIFEEVRSICSESTVDLAVVCWDASAYAAAQRARQHAFSVYDSAVRAAVPIASEAGGNWDFGPRTAMLHEHAGRLAAHTRAGRLSLFLGAGVSAGAGIPSWAQLLTAINRELGHEAVDEARATRLDPRDFAALVERRFQTSRGKNPDFGKTLASKLRSDRHSLQHGLIAALPVHEVVTTNFDNLFELAARSAGRTLSVLPADPQPDAERWLLKIHGSVDQPGSIVFTRAAYLDAPREQGALFGLVQAMLLTRHMLFIGYSLSDEDFHEVVYDVRRAMPGSVRRDKLGTAVTLFEDTLKCELWQDDVDVVAVRDAPTGEPTDVDIAEAARDVERFLDLVGFLTADMARFVLDDAYVDMLNLSEQRLGQTLRSVIDAVDPSDDGPGWKQVNELLHRLGRPAAIAHD